jgi:PAS domain S-box-containing protein
MNSDRSLLFGAIAMQAELISADQFAKACSIWSSRQSVPLPDILRELGWLSAEDQVHVDYLIERKLAKSGGDVHASLAGCPANVRSVLASICNDPGGQAIAADPGGLAASGRAGDRYSLSRLHAAGGIGEIWLARDADLQRDVAVKRLQSAKSDSTVDKIRFLREARITGQLDHPGVVPIYEICLDAANGQPYYSMRFLKGRTLTDAVKEYHEHRQAGRSDPQAFLGLLSAFCIVCNTVAYAHSKGIVHRDLKCDNVILGDYGEVVVIDWGLAKEIGTHEVATAGKPADLTAASPAATLAGHVLGTPAYMAPEQAAGRLDLIGPATDVYGLCAILYEILCGRPPFQGRFVMEVLHKVQRQPPAPPSISAPGIPEALEQICLKGLAKAQAERHRSADALAKAVQTWVSELAERRQSEGERERFFALSLDLLAIIDDAGQLRQVSPAWERLLGYQRPQLVGRKFLDFVHAADRPAAQQAVAADANARAFEARALHPDGSFRWISWNVTPIAKERCVYVVGRDITELKRSQQLFEGVLQSAPDAMILINRERQIVMANRQMERVFGYAQGELLGQPVEVLVPKQYRERHPDHVAGFFASASFRPMGAGLSLRGVRKDGVEFPADISLSPINTEAGLLVAASIRDVTERHLAAERRMKPWFFRLFCGWTGRAC